LFYNEERSIILVSFDLLRILREIDTHVPHDLTHRFGLSEFTLLHKFKLAHKAQLVCESVHVLIDVHRLHDCGQ
jgi:hypothetical protein